MQSVRSPYETDDRVNLTIMPTGHAMIPPALVTEDHLPSIYHKIGIRFIDGHVRRCHRRSGKGRKSKQFFELVILRSETQTKASFYHLQLTRHSSAISITRRRSDRPGPRSAPPRFGIARLASERPTDGVHF